MPMAANGWLYAEGDAAGYDRARALFPADVLAWVQAIQPKAWELLTKNHGAKAADALLTRLREQLDQRGTLEVLRQGVDLLGLKQSLKLAEFKPALAINPDILARYGANGLRAARHEGDPAEPCRALGIAAGEGGELRERRKCAPPGRGCDSPSSPLKSAGTESAARAASPPATPWSTCAISTAQPGGYASAISVSAGS